MSHHHHHPTWIEQERASRADHVLRMQEQELVRRQGQRDAEALSRLLVAFFSLPFRVKVGVGHLLAVVALLVWLGQRSLGLTWLLALGALLILAPLRWTGRTYTAALLGVFALGATSVVWQTQGTGQPQPVGSSSAAALPAPGTAESASVPPDAGRGAAGTPDVDSAVLDQLREQGLAVDTVGCGRTGQPLREGVEFSCDVGLSDGSSRLVVVRPSLRAAGWMLELDAPAAPDQGAATAPSSTSALCQELKEAGLTRDEMLAEFGARGRPASMDGDGDGLPCSVTFPPG